MSTKSTIAYDDLHGFHLYREMSNGATYLECTAEASLDSSGNLSINLSNLPTDLIAALAKQLTKMTEDGK